jgi:predicted O-methyltransferase YrrM
MWRKLLSSGVDLLCPGPSNGRNGKLRQQILDLETKKRDCNLQQLLELETRSPLPSAWSGLGTIAYEIVSHFKPQKIVELGSYNGFSTFAMGLALRDLKMDGRIYAVDTWMGDNNMGLYGEEVYQSFLENKHKLGLDGTVCPLRMTFAEASKQITPPIDLLHVDGLHSITAVTSDFKAFRHLLAPGAIVLFHDVYTKFAGMRLFWALISRRYPSYRIPYSHGLGVIQIP